MDYDISLSGDGNYVIVKYKGNIKTEIALKATVESHAFAKKFGVFCILVDAVESRNLEKTIRNYEFAYGELQNVKINRQMRLRCL